MSTLDGLARVLDAAGIGTYSPTDPLPAGATPITVLELPPEPDTAVCVMTYDGPEPDSRNGDEFPRLQVRVRARNPLDAIALDRACFTALQFRPGGPAPRTLPGSTTWLQDCYALQSEPTSLGVDANGRAEFVRNYQIECHPA